jgi:outer membrane lipoprotein-sorting protein
MSKAYANCKTYRDSGVVKTIFLEAVEERTVLKPSTTAFVRPDRFRFEYSERFSGSKDYRYIIWRNGKDIQTWWDAKPGVKKGDSLFMAIARAAGVSGGSALTVPALLFSREFFGLRLLDSATAKRIKNAKLENWDCFRIEGKLMNQSRTVWLDKETFLVRRIDSGQEFAKFSTVVTTTYYPVIDEEIAEKLLNFDPPAF